MAIRFLESGNPYPSKRFLTALFDCVFLLPPDVDPPRKSTKVVLADREAYDYIFDLISTAVSEEKRIDWDRKIELYELLDPVVGPFEINSEGTDWWLFVAEELRVRYGWNDAQLREQVGKIAGRPRIH